MNDPLDKLKDVWKEYQYDFDNLTDDQIEYESMIAQRDLDEAESWLEAVELWKQAGKPRNQKD